MAGWSVWILVVLVSVFGAAVCGSVSRTDGRGINKRSEACYNRVGCFSTGSPFFSLTSRPVNMVPEPPDEIRTKFLLFRRPNIHDGYVLDARTPDDFPTVWPEFKADKPLKFVVHGFVDNIYANMWQNSTKDALLTYGDYNVVLVDWSQGNFFPYTQATGNTRLVGAQIADLIHSLQWQAKLKPEDIHIIGHSLGAHIAGYAGERVTGMGRITGLDPAGPYFDGTDKVVRLDETDANFVDVLHSDAQSLLKMGLGSRMSLGHVDFWPNLGHDQPGCDKSVVQHISDDGLLTGASHAVACNHLRSLTLFIESVNSKCPFMAYPCDSEDNFKTGLCFACGTSGCSRMGFHADQVKPKQKTDFYLSTSGDRPFCQYHMKLDIHMSASLTKERGILKAQVICQKGTSPWFVLNQSPQYFEGRKLYTFYVGVPADLGDVSAIKLGWNHDSSLLKPFDWNILGLRHPKLFVDRVVIRREEVKAEIRLCANDLSIETDQEEILNTVC